MYTSSYFYRGVKKKSFFDELPYSLLATKNIPLQKSSGNLYLTVGSDNNYAWSTGNFCFRPKNEDRNKLGQNGIMAQLIYYASESRLRGKIRRIENALEADPVDVDTLGYLAITGDGLINNDIRTKVWPKLLLVNVYDIPKPTGGPKKRRQHSFEEEKVFRKNKYWNQVHLDVKRSQRRFPPNLRVSRRTALQGQVINVIMRVLCRNPELHYYQGYHDVAVTLLLVNGEELATALLEQISLHQLRDFMDHNMERTSQMLALIHAIIEAADATLERFLRRCDVGHMFALSWLITWFAHVINDPDTIFRIFDFFLGTHPLMPIYLGAALVISHRDELLSCECEMSTVHHFLCSLPRHIPQNLERLIEEAHALFKKYSPQKLESASKRYLKESSAVKIHDKFVKELSNQRPDVVLRRRRTALISANQTTDRLQPEGNSGSSGIFVKLAFWALSAGVGTMAFYVATAAKKWM
ncbi:TBC1 domain family member 20-like [Dendronephthya gigantea]|uniref:TBC1 domain family member 20-like n=1 Tax=Dendronephthya gigantea TaxID=151771 RepID=UPI00106CE966|nr:TBC1 domain family member 20-like [Dendronephthya gigantea]